MRGKVFTPEKRKPQHKRDFFPPVFLSFAIYARMMSGATAILDQKATSMRTKAHVPRMAEQEDRVSLLPRDNVEQIDGCQQKLSLDFW